MTAETPQGLNFSNLDLQGANSFPLRDREPQQQRVRMIQEQLRRADALMQEVGAIDVFRGFQQDLLRQEVPVLIEMGLATKKNGDQEVGKVSEPILSMRWQPVEARPETRVWVSKGVRVRLEADGSVRVEHTERGRNGHDSRWKPIIAVPATPELRVTLQEEGFWEEWLQRRLRTGMMTAEFAFDYRKGESADTLVGNSDQDIQSVPYIL